MLEDFAMATKEKQIVVRLPAELADKIETYADQLRREQPGPKWSTSDVVRKVLSEALEATTKRKR
jgi:hypothetical protein